MANPVTAVGLRHALTDNRLLYNLVTEQVVTGDQADASANIATLITNLQTVQTSINASTNATINTATVSYALIAPLA